VKIKVETTFLHLSKKSGALGIRRTTSAMELSFRRLAHNESRRRSTCRWFFLVTHGSKDGSMGFDFAGTYTKIIDHNLIESTFGDRALVVEFITGKDGVTVRETFDAEAIHPVEYQRGGWLAILNNFKKHVESRQRA